MYRLRRAEQASYAWDQKNDTTRKLRPIAIS